MTEVRAYQRAFWIAVLITLAAWLLPFGGLAIYPFSLLATWAHELGHGLTALLAGGRFQRLELFPGLSGLAFTAVQGTAASALVAAGGLLGPPLLGALTIALGVRPAWSRGLLVALAAALLLSAALWVRNPFGLVAVPLLGLAALAVALRFKPERRFVIAQLVGIQLGLSALRNWQYLFVDEVRVGGRLLPSDTGSIARLLGGSYWLWGLLILVLELALVYGAYRLVRRRLQRES